MDPVPANQTQEELNLFLLNELERLNLVVSAMQRRGVLSADDLALAQLQQELKQEERKLRVAAARRDSLGVLGAEAEIQKLGVRIGALSALNPWGLTDLDRDGGT